jgi:DNA-binding NarL/FixJ family response regulator
MCIEAVQEAMDLGASGYVQKRTAGTDLQIAVQSVLGGERFISPGLIADLTEA